MIRINRLLVPIDFSEFSTQALRYGQELCETFGAELHLLHTLEVHVSNTPQFAFGLALPDRFQESTEQVIRRMNELAAGAWAENKKVVRETAHGSPTVEIVNYAKVHDIDIIVIGTHGRTGLSHVLMGSVAEYVVRQAPCPVLVVRTEGHQIVSP